MTPALRRLRSSRVKARVGGGRNEALNGQVDLEFEVVLLAVTVGRRKQELGLNKVSRRRRKVEESVERVDESDDRAQEELHRLVD